ncbi:uncharacterized protein LOC111612626 [Centruroides sculpturatus]|uniref:uncharacterized protein LOC111612626 n=1 Tax=Centruroides sculpturatus TaxID=218467 RepID=UPI000C6CD8D4|nr:uncharacterized protein LOC111612626 [Centruroides sculpturatus]
MRIIEYSPKKENDFNGYTRYHKLRETLLQSHNNSESFKDKMSIKGNDCQLKYAKENSKTRYTGNNINYNSKNSLSKSGINTSQSHNSLSLSYNKCNKVTKDAKVSETVTESKSVEDNSKSRNKAIGSLNNSPKWSRIKDKFERGDSHESLSSLQPSISENISCKDSSLRKSDNKMYSKSLSSNASVTTRKKSSTLPSRLVSEDLKSIKTFTTDKNLSTFKMKTFDISKNSSKLLKESNAFSKDVIKQKAQAHTKLVGNKRTESCTNQDSKINKKSTENHPIPALRTSLNKNKTNQIYTNVSLHSLNEKKVASSYRTVKDKKYLSDNEKINRYGFKTKNTDSTKSHLQKNSSLSDHREALLADCIENDQQRNDAKESKVAYLTNKFNSLSCQKPEMKKSNSVVNVDESKCHILSKSFSSSNVFTTLQKNETESQLKNNSQLECLPVENMPCTAIEKCSCLGLFTKSADKNNKTQTSLSDTSKNEKICTQPLGNKNLQLQDLKLESEELSLVQKAILSYEENLALSSPEIQKRHFISHSRNNSLSSISSKKSCSNPSSPKPKPISYIDKEFKQDSIIVGKSDIKTNKNQEFRKQSFNSKDDKRPPIMINEKKSKSFCLDSRISSEKTQKEEILRSDVNSHRYMNQQEVKLSKSLKPNESFLWSHSTSAQHRKFNTRSEAVYMNDMATTKHEFRNCKKIHNKDNEQTTNVENEYNNIGSCDSDEQESWVDISDIELENSEKYSNSSIIPSAFRRNKVKKDCYRKSQARRSWSDSMRAAKNKTEQNNEYQDISLWETIDGENSSESNDGDPQYEPLYESVYQNIIFDGESNGSQSPDDISKHSSETFNEVFDNEDVSASNIKENSSDIGRTKKKLVRNWSLTRSDIRLELSSKLNKIMTKRNVHSSIELGMKEKQQETNSKRNTLMKYFLGQRSNTAGPLLNSSSGRKDMSTFYVDIKENGLKDSCSDVSLKSSNSLQDKDYYLKSEQFDIQLKKTQSMKPLLRKTIQRPTAPPPLPPDSIVKCRTGTKSMELIRSHTVAFNKTRSLDSTCYNDCNEGDILYNNITIENNFPNKASVSEISSISTSEGEIISSSSSDRTISGNSSPSYSKSSRHSDNYYSVSSSITDSSMDKEMSSLHSDCRYFIIFFQYVYRIFNSFKIYEYKNTLLLKQRQNCNYNVQYFRETKPDFLEVLHRLESSPVCQCLNMHSFLMLPMQRITRLPLLVDAIFHRLPTHAPNYENCKMTLAVLNKVVQECNEQTRQMERVEEMVTINRSLDFKDCKGLPLVSASRWLVKRGELTRFYCDSSSKRTISFSTRWSKVPVYLFLFTDYLLITKKKSEENFVVLDYCPRNMLQVMSLEDMEEGQIVPRLPSNRKNFFQLTMLKNHKGKTVELILSANLESERTRWMDAVTPPLSDNPDEKIYEVWDCPQVQCIFSYVAQQPDELTIEECDVVNVFRKMSDGWYEGERIRDGVRGWFPASYTVEIVSSHVRTRNLRQRCRLMMLSQSTLK